MVSNCELIRNNDYENKLKKLGGCGVENNKKVDKRLLTETLIVIAVTILLFLTFNNLKSIIPVIPAIYLLVERRIRHRSWSDIGFKTKNVLSDIRMNWHLILLVGVVFQLLACCIAKYCVPGYIEHIISRLPLNVDVIIPVIITITTGTFLEEVVFRGFVQGRLELFTTPVKAIIASSFLFAFMHYSYGSIAVVALDLFGVFADSILFGVIFTRTKNIFASWVAHYLGDIVGIVCLLFFL